MLQAMLDRQENRFNVDVHQPVPVGLIQLVQKLHLDDPGAVDDGLQPSELSNCLLDRREDRRFAPDVTFDKDCSATCATDLFGDGLALASLPIDQSNGGSLAGEEPRDSFTHAGGGAADPRDLVLKPCAHVKLIWLSPGSAVRRATCICRHSGSWGVGR